MTATARRLATSTTLACLAAMTSAHANGDDKSASPIAEQATVFLHVNSAGRRTLQLIPDRDDQHAPPLPTRTFVLVQADTALTPAQQATLRHQPARARKVHLDAVLAARADDAVAHLLRAGAETELGEGEAALRDLDPVMAAFGPAEADVIHAVRSEALIELARYDEALEEAGRAIAAAPAAPGARMAFAWASYAAGKDRAQALRDIQAVVESDADSFVAQRRLAVLLRAQDGPEAGSFARQRATLLDPTEGYKQAAWAEEMIQLGKLDQARQLADGAIRFGPDNPHAWVLRARLDGIQQRIDEVIADATYCLTLAADPVDQAEAYLLRGTAWGIKDAPDKMTADLDKGALVDPSSSSFLLTRGQWEARHQRWADAKASLTRALVIEPACAPCLATRAYAEAQSGERTAALQDGKAAVASDPDSADVRGLYGETLAWLDEPAQALKQFDAALAIDPANDTAWTGRGNADQALGENARAIVDFSQVLDRGQWPNLADLVLRRGVAYDHEGQFARAADDFARAATLSPTNAEPVRYLGRERENLDDYGAAADAFARSYALEQDANTGYSLARMNLYLGHFSQAADTWRSVRRTEKSTSAYTPLWIYLARVRADASDEAAARAELVELSPAHQPRAWTDSLADFMLGRIDLATLQQRADDGPADKRRGNHCEADYYVAEIELSRGHRAAALPLLEDAVRLCPPTFVEARAAKVEQRLQAAAMSAAADQ